MALAVSIPMYFRLTTESVNDTGRPGYVYYVENKNIS